MYFITSSVIPLIVVLVLGCFALFILKNFVSKMPTPKRQERKMPEEIVETQTEDEEQEENLPKIELNKKEINKLIGLTKQKGYSLVPLNMYFKGSLVKVELGVGKGKKLYDKREDIAKKDAEMKMKRALKNFK